MDVDGDVGGGQLLTVPDVGSTERLEGCDEYLKTESDDESGPDADVVHPEVPPSVGRVALGPLEPPNDPRYRDVPTDTGDATLSLLEEGSVKHGEITSDQDQELEDSVPREDGQPK